MPKFKLDKLVRDNLRNIYASIGQKAKYQKLTPDEHKSQLVRKIIEEVQEIQISDPISDITDEIADIRQVLDDLMELYGISEDEVKKTQQKTYDKKAVFQKELMSKLLSWQVTISGLNIIEKDPIYSRK